MTTIAWDGKTLAADKQCSDGNHKFAVTKIKRVNGELLGFSGGLYRCKEMLAWYCGERKPEDFPKGESDDFSELMVIRDGKIFLYGSKYPIEVEDNRFAVGSGSPYALAAMECGLSAEDAVQTAIKFDPSTGMGIDILTWGRK
jgi:hypothetical protein